MDTRQFIYARNNSNRSVCLYISNEYPDTTLPGTNQYVQILNPGTSTKVWECSGKRENEFGNDFPNDTAIIFFFNPDTIRSYDWNIIRDKYKISGRRILSKHDFEKLNWVIVYP
jgi:hypothetical protein